MKKSTIFSAKVVINQQIILGNDKFNLKVKLFFGNLIRERLKKGEHLIKVTFNQQAMNKEVYSFLS